MATEAISGPLGEFRAASTASGGTALTTTATRIVLPLGSKQMTLIPRNAAGGATVVRFNVNPWLTILKTTDLLAASANLTDYSINAQDGLAATDITLSSLGTLAQSDALFVGSHLPFSGVQVDIDAANGTASVLTVAYWDGTTWTDISATDGTDAAGATMGQDGNITWTVPTAWVTAGLVTSVATAQRNQGIFTEPLFWTRFVFSAALDASTTLNSMIAINRDTTYAEFPVGMTVEEAVTVGPGGICSVTALTDVGTANLIVNVATRSNGRFA